MSNRSKSLSVLSCALVIFAAPLPSTAADTTGLSPIKPSGMMTRDELRNCFKLEKTIDSQAKAADQTGTKLQSEKDGITATTADLDALRDELGKQREALGASDGKVRENANKLQGWNQELHRIAAAPDSVPVATRKKIEADYADLSKQNKTLMAERDTIYKKYTEGAKKYNANAATLEKQIKDWTAKNKKFNDDAAALVKMRTDYASGCTNRPFLEADRAAVKAGQ